ncbi:uncharacterized protein VTP21DRAFT_4995 [Calcarisporiella thermophila]|uniref:uncharacterized protein n=1 Tax=Calcarisporiella thermophila TaxID=911321 RepID=UPI00374317CA
MKSFLAQAQPMKCWSGPPSPSFLSTPSLSFMLRPRSSIFVLRDRGSARIPAWSLAVWREESLDQTLSNESLRPIGRGGGAEGTAQAGQEGIRSVLEKQQGWREPRPGEAREGWSNCAGLT